MTQQEFQKRYTYNATTDKLGEGGFGSVFKAYDNHLDRWVALKISKVNPQYENIRLKKEAEMVAKLPTHPNIARYEECYTFSSFDGEYDFGILQYYEEGNLSQLLKNNTLTLEQKQSLLVQILEGLDFLHQNGIIHRDLKPQNILIVKRQNEYIPKITDFGISKQLDINKSSVFSNSIAGAGTLSYASPEQLADREIRKNTDLWSFGVIAYQTFTGQLPFNTGEHASTSEAGRTELFRQINSGKLPPEINNIPEPWQTLIRKCLVIDPAQRIKNEEEVKTILSGEKVASNIVPDDKTKIDKPKEEKSETKRDDTLIEKEYKKPKSPVIDPSQKPKDNVWKKVLLGVGAAAVVFVAIFYLLHFISTKTSEGGLPEKPVPPRLVNDFAAIFTPEQQAALEQKLDAYDYSDSVQIAVVTINDLKGLGIDDFSIRLFNKWGIGYKKYNNGVLILISNDSREVRITTGLGMQEIIPDTVAKKIIDQIIIPEFKQNNFYLGVNKAVDEIIKIYSGRSRFADFTETGAGLNLEMIAVHGGTFKMGSIAGSAESPIHAVTVSSFYIGKYEVTQAQWKAIMGKNPSKNKGDNLPVEMVSWNDVQKFIVLLNSQTGKNYRLPTEAEWEFAARGGDKSQGYKYSGSNTISDVAWYTGNSTHPVGTKKANELGIYDMSGNVWEWCNDWYSKYNNLAQNNPQGPSIGSARVVRGGAFGEGAFTVTVRLTLSPNDSGRGSDVGFRLALSSK